MKRITYWALTTMTALVLLFGYHTSTSGPSLTAPTSIASGAAGFGSAADGGSAGSDTSESGTDPETSTSDTGAGLVPDSSAESQAPQTTAGSDDSGTDGTVTGEAVDTRWGPVQVAITVSNGTITDVSVPVYPQNNQKDQEINAYALPILVDETLSAQSAEVDMVSGATVTSLGYQQSLQSALDQAGL